MFKFLVGEWNNNLAPESFYDIVDISISSIGLDIFILMPRRHHEIEPTTFMCVEQLVQWKIYYYFVFIL